MLCFFLSMLINVGEAWASLRFSPAIL